MAVEYLNAVFRLSLNIMLFLAFFSSGNWEQFVDYWSIVVTKFCIVLMHARLVCGFLGL